MISKRLHPASFSNVNTQLAQKANIAQEDWITPTLLNSWTSYGTPYDNVSYMKDTLGFVHMRGVIQNGVSIICAQLPVGYRPAQKCEFTSVRDFADSGVGKLSISADGYFRTAGYGTRNYSLDNICFKAV